MCKTPNRFDDLKIGDKVRCRGSGIVAGPFSGTGTVTAIDGNGITVKTYSGPRVSVARHEITFACHNEGAPFTSYTGGKDEGYLDGWKTGWTWPRYRWNHDPGGPHCARDLQPRHRLTEQCRHKEAYDKATMENFRAWHRGFKDGERLRLARRNDKIDWNKPLETDNGERVELVCLADSTAVIRMLETHRWCTSMCINTEWSVRMRDGTFLHDLQQYVRNVYMPYGKRSGYILISTVNSDARFYEDHQEASDQLRLCDGTYILCTCEQQARSEGGIYETVNIGGPVEPLPPLREVRYLNVVRHPHGQIGDTLHSQRNPTRGSRRGDNLKLTFEGDVLVDAEVLK